MSTPPSARRRTAAIRLKSMILGPIWAVGCSTTAPMDVDAPIFVVRPCKTTCTCLQEALVESTVHGGSTPMKARRSYALIRDVRGTSMPSKIDVLRSLLSRLVVPMTFQIFVTASRLELTVASAVPRVGSRFRWTRCFRLVQPIVGLRLGPIGSAFTADVDSAMVGLITHVLTSGVRQHKVA